MTDIYDQHQKAFARVSAFVVLDPTSGERVATVAIKFPADGAGRLYAYVHWLGFPMVRGWASGGGYDKRSAAVESAIAKTRGALVDNGGDSMRFADALRDVGGSDWTRAVEKAGFAVLQAV